jgi:predicted nucleic acid-binding protein
MIVLDASATIEVLLQTPRAAEIKRRVLGGPEPLHAPYVLDLEVAQVLRRFVASGELAESRARGALQDLRDMPVMRYPHDLLLDRIWVLRKNLTAYDAAYVALAEALDAPLLTCDQRIAKAPGHRAKVEVV